MLNKSKVHIVHKVLADFITVAVSLLGLFYDSETQNINLAENSVVPIPTWVWYILFSLIMMALMWFIWDLFSRLKEIKQIRLTEMEVRLSQLMLKFNNKVNNTKKLDVLEITYGKKPTFNPIDFSKNYLVYGVHKQIRTILNELADAIREFAGQSDPDTIKVDLVYCYPEECPHSNVDERKNIDAGKWKIIKAVTDAPTDMTHIDLLSDQNSFYFYFREHSYAFKNDKNSTADNIPYKLVQKDNEKNGVGSVVGQKFSIVNDVPVKEQVRAILTITTYGWTLWNKSYGVSLEEFKNLFVKYVINGCKSVLSTELTQKYIRHRIQNGVMCAYSGMSDPRLDLPIKEDGKEEPADSTAKIYESFDCPFCTKGGNNVKCFKTGNECSFFKNREIVQANTIDATSL